jgi:ribosomal protein S18 acetylase RimI-like enzyme
VKKLLIDYRNEFDDQTCFTSFEQEMENIELYYSDPDKIKLIAVDEEYRIHRRLRCYEAIYNPGIAEMKRLYVVPAFRGYKLGRILAEAIMDKAAEQGFHSMILDTMHEMHAAQQLYFNLGFHTIPSLPSTG